ncbi:family 43 glycosylhydrolase [Maribellus maritimus]|uniref:family 43 glycosylhydrolase n=1 Tax=Maribellus maritimus TaxID=2870838 RepID=UPI001EEA01E0|nr:family 43 glycosylhydrolase [Maribellus maritimus]MCG6186308.1 family 43 glycosylhydrolase [Maribellus maritimus]
MQRIESTLFLIFILIVFSKNELKSQTLNPQVSAMFENAIDSIEPTMPNVWPLFKYHLRDIAVCKGPENKYYLTGTTDDNWGVAEGIRVWESSDLKDWQIIGDDGFVWTFEKDASNEAQRRIKRTNGRLVRGIWAPEIHYINNNFWITYSVSGGYGSGLLKSTTGKPEGPYEDVKKEGAMVKGIDATLFKDVDGTVWYIWGPGNMKKLKPDMMGFADTAPPVFPKDASGKEVGYEGVNMYYKNGLYYLMAAEWNCESPKKGHVFGNTDVNRRTADGRYDCMIAMAENITGPYSEAYIAIPHGGHNMIFDDFDGNIRATMFGNDEAAAQWRENAALLQMKLDDKKRLVPVVPFPSAATEKMPVIYVSEKGDNSNGKSWKTALTSLQEAVELAKPKSQIWIAGGNYGNMLKIEGKTALYIYGGFKGVEKKLSDRKMLTTTKIDGQGKTAHVLTIVNSEYLRIDGLIVTGGKNTGQKTEGNGAGIWLENGGESVRFVNCTISNNYAIKDGGGIYAANGASPLFVGCDIINNEANLNGGAVYVNCNADNGYHTRFYNCNISNNKAQANGGIAWFITDLKQTGTLRFINSLLNNNFTLLEGGNIVMNGGSTLLMSHCTVVNNRGMSKGAAISQLGRVPAQNRIINSIFANNYGAALFVADAYEGSDPTSAREQKWTEIQNNLFFNNETLSLCRYSYKAADFKTAQELNTENWAADNLEGNPHFVNPGNSNFKLKKGSKAIGAGTLKNAFPVDFFGEKRFTDFDTTTNKIDIGFQMFSEK